MNIWLANGIIWVVTSALSCLSANYLAVVCAGMCSFYCFVLWAKEEHEEET